jgi:WhiB family redox-sensing transcriptional regulator
MSSHYPTEYEDPEFLPSIGPLPAWRTKAACLDEDPELFFPNGNTGRALEQIEQAKAVCLTCSVSDQCLQWALKTKQDAGVWGGTSEDERRSLKRRKAGRAGG